METKSLVVVGAGVAGTAAAIEAAQSGVQVTLIDENPISASMMGLDVPQFFGKRVADTLSDKESMLQRMTAANPALDEAAAAGVDVQLGTCVWGAFRNTETSRKLDGPQLGLADDKQSWVIKYDRLIVAAGSRDLVISFAGSNLAGAMGANGAHALLSRYQASTSRRMVILGSGNVGLHTAKMARANGIEVVAIVDVFPSVRGDGSLMKELQQEGVDFYTSHTLKEAVGSEDGIESVVLVAVNEDNEPVSGSEKTIAADTVCLAIGLVPNIELLSLLDCDISFKSELGGYVPDHDDCMRTSLEGVYVAGDVAGLHDGMVLNPEIARNQGRLAGIGAAESLGAIDSGEARARRAEIRAEAAARPAAVHLVWNQWLQSLVNVGGMDVLACECEEVSRAELIDLQPPRYLNWRSEQMSSRNVRTQVKDGPVDPDQVRRLTRVGMGQCQGRRCREQVSLLLAAESGTDLAKVPFMSYRPPVRPLPLSVMWPHDETDEMRENWVKWFIPVSRVLG
ncbi:MAG: NAD(P)/FAD-dependent oxidoreductase [Chloroflexota bacterium]|nr:NAD(P)/FAD-dependent oxidoreductase [Chloroflexota bacterium]